MIGKVIWLAPLAALTACGTIDQVPLVYVSSMKVGVNVASGTAEAPGAKLNIGYDGTDAAFVPVFAGRKCDRQRAADCAAYPLVPIRGNNDISPAQFVTAARAQTDALQRNTQSVTAAQATLLAALGRQAEAQRKVDAFVSDQNRLVAIGAAPVTPLPDGTAAADPFAAERVRLTAATKGLSPQVELDQQTNLATAAQGQLDQAMSDLDRARVALFDLLAQGPSQIGKREDALSVYGSFDSKTDVAGEAKPTAGLNLGKAFSTGIAAQLLTEGIKTASVARATAGCLAMAQDLATTAIASNGVRTYDSARLDFALKTCDASKYMR